MGDDKETIRGIITSGIIGTLAATIRALLARDESPLKKLATFFAGVCMALLMGWILRNSSMSGMWKEIIVGICGAFVSTFWPILETFIKRYTKSKADAIIRDNDNKSIGKLGDDSSID